jgi:invasion protein IalB
MTRDAPVGKDMLAALQKAEKLIVTFQDLQKQTITVPMPLAGFAEAYQKLP